MLNMSLTVGIFLFHLLIIGLGEARVTNRTALSTELSGNFTIPGEEVIAGLIIRKQLTKRFEVFTKQLDWYAAAVFCKERHGNLATIKSQDENDAMLAAMNYSKVLVPAYIGGTGSQSDRGYFWISDGASLTYRNWAANRPVGTSVNQCIAFNAFTVGTWDHYFCSSARPFACEYISVGAL